MPGCGFGFPHIRSDGEAVLHPARKTCSSGICNLSGTPQKTKKPKRVPHAAVSGVMGALQSDFITNVKSDE